MMTKFEQQLFESNVVQQRSTCQKIILKEKNDRLFLHFVHDQSIEDVLDLTIDRNIFDAYLSLDEESPEETRKKTH